MDLKAYYLEYKNLPWYYGACTNTLIDARVDAHCLWKQMCIREPVRLVVPPLESYEELFTDDDDYD